MRTLKFRRRLARITGFVSTTVLVAGIALAAPATATSLGTWSRSTTGASGGGTVSVSNGYIRNVLHITDTKADGSCAYVWTEFQHHDALLMLWFKSTNSPNPARSEVCGNGTTLYTTVQASINNVDAVFADKIRLKVTVCRNVNNAFDNCSDSFLSASYSL